MIELSKQFPTPEVLERIATALGIEAYELFRVPPSPESSIERLYHAVANNIDQLLCEKLEQQYQTIAKNLEQVVADAIDKNLAEHKKK